MSERPVFTARYHHEDGTWWAEIDGWNFSATAAILDELRDDVATLIPFGIDERLPKATSIMFLHWQPTSTVKVDPQAQEQFVIEA